MTRILLIVAGLLLTGCSTASESTGGAGPVSPEVIPAAPCDPGPPGTRTVNVGKRSFLLHVPTDHREPSPVVFTFHGRGSNAQQQLLLTGFEQVAEEGRFMVVAPQARDGRWDFEGGDWDYLQAVADAVPCMDRSRVYASGMSMGSAMTFALACAPQRTFAAFGGVALTLYEPQCEQSPPAPIIYFHGTRDQVVRFGGGQPANEDVTLPSVPAAMRDWAQHNECTVTQTTDVAKDVRLREWTGCADDVEVDYYRVRGGGHTWPGTSPFIADAVEQSLGKTTQSVNASRLMWEFFQEYSLPTA